MTPDPVTVTPATPVGRIAQMMVDAHIHRLVVIDKNQNPVGIVSATDILGALARFHQEPWPGPEKSQAELVSTR
jgi:CBS domain-containing protein